MDSHDTAITNVSISIEMDSKIITSGRCPEAMPSWGPTIPCSPQKRFRERSLGPFLSVFPSNVGPGMECQRSVRIARKTDRKGLNPLFEAFRFYNCKRQNVGQVRILDTLINRQTIGCSKLEPFCETKLG